MRKIFLLFQLVCFLVGIQPAKSQTQELIHTWTRWETGQAGAAAPSENSAKFGPDGHLVVSGANMVAKYTRAGNNMWSHVLSFPDGYEPGAMPMAVDNAGNIYVTAVNVKIDKNVFTGSQDIYIAKLSPTGNLLWTRWFDGTLHFTDISTAIDVDQYGNVYVTGRTQVAVEPIYNVVTLKYDALGQLKWIARYAGLSSEGNAIAVDYYTGDVYVGGTAKINTENGLDFMVLKYNTNGEQKWISLHAGNPAYNRTDQVYAIAIDPDGNVIATGYTTENYNSDCCGEQDSRAYCTSKHDRNTGAVLWRKKYGSEQVDGASAFHSEANAIAIDSQYNVYVTGHSINANANDGSREALTIKYSKYGETLWTKRYNNVNFVPNNIGDDDNDVGLAIAIDPDGNPVVAGYTQNNAPAVHDFLVIKYMSNGDLFDVAHFDHTYNDRAADLAIDSFGNIYVTGRAGDIHIVRYDRCGLYCPANVVEPNTAGECGAIVNYPNAVVSGDCGPVEYSHPSGSYFPVGKTTVTVSSAGSGESCTFTVTVTDTEVPVITCPANLTVSCASDVPPVNTGSVTATDNCGPPAITHVSDVISDMTCANRYTITRTYKATDASGNSSTCTQIIRVEDMTPPQILNMSTSQTALWPPNHTMRDITVNYQVVDNCVSAPNTTITVTSNEPVNGTADGDTDPDWEIIDLHHIRLRAERASNGNGRIYTITVTVDDGCNPAVSQSKQVMVAHNITGPVTGHPFKVGSTVTFNGTFYDMPGITHSSKWLLDSSAATNGIVTEPSGTQNGKVTGSYKFNTPGVYKLQMNVTGATGNTSYVNTYNDLDALVVIYDPNGGNAYGGGWFQSPTGALANNTTATGKASYGFAVNYRNAAKPKGETQFQFKIGGLEFNALNFDYLAINNGKAQFRGTGKIIGGQSGIGFIMTVSDGGIDGTGTDKIRMKIYNRNTGYVYYDNQPGAIDNADPLMVVGSNSTIVIQGAEVVSAARSEQVEVNRTVPVAGGKEFTVLASPNPSNLGFNVLISGAAAEEKLTFKCFDALGRLVEQRKELRQGVVIRFGEYYKPGIYFLKIISAKETKTIKLVKN